MLYIKNLKLNNFRCFKSRAFDFEPNINILVGNNGCGKTSVVEGISYLCLGKSFKNAKDKEVLCFDEDFFNVIGTIVEKDESKLVVSYDGKQKKIKNRETVYKTLSEHVGIYKLISFCPDDLEIIKGTPSKRRNFLDVFISQYDNIYLKTLVEYKKVLKMRNEFLKSIENNTYDTVMYDVINENLVRLGKIIIELRQKYISVLNNKVLEVSKKLLKDDKSISIKYLADVDSFSLEKTIENNKKLDIMSKSTTRGPQRDDVLVMYDGKDAAIYSSQGQVRITVLAIKLAIHELFSNINNNVSMILDDVFSELDIERQLYLMKYIKNVGQVFITTTEIDKLPKELTKDSNIIEIKEGECNVWFKW